MWHSNADFKVWWEIVSVLTVLNNKCQCTQEITAKKYSAGCLISQCHSYARCRGRGPWTCSYGNCHSVLDTTDWPSRQVRVVGGQLNVCSGHKNNVQQIFVVALHSTPGGDSCPPSPPPHPTKAPPPSPGPNAAHHAGARPRQWQLLPQEPDAALTAVYQVFWVIHYRWVALSKD